MSGYKECAFMNTCPKADFEKPLCYEFAGKLEEKIAECQKDNSYLYKTLRVVRVPVNIVGGLVSKLVMPFLKVS